MAINQFYLSALKSTSTNIYDARPLLKWAGGKTQLLSTLSEYFPQSFGNYFEPFAGSLAVFFHLRRQKGEFEACLGDFNNELINCYNVVKNEARFLFPLLRRHQKSHTKSYYLSVRKQKTSELPELQRAARLIYLNKTCYNGLYRVNNSGEFNVPMGSYKNPRIFDEKNLKSASNAFKNTVIYHGDFSTILDCAKKRDLIYLDPPYYTETDGFTGYALQKRSGKAGFGAEEHRRLAEVANILKKRKCKIIISNSNTKYIRALYSKFKITVVHARRQINCNGSGRGLTKELIITN